MEIYFFISFQWWLVLRQLYSGVIFEDLFMSCPQGKGKEGEFWNWTHACLLCDWMLIWWGVQSGCACLCQVLQLGGIPALVSLLRSPHAAVNLAAAGALRNLVFKHHRNKMEVEHCGGIAKALQLLKETNSTETQKQITGRKFSCGRHLRSLGCIYGTMPNPKVS